MLPEHRRWQEFHLVRYKKETQNVPQTAYYLSAYERQIQKSD